MGAEGWFNDPSGRHQLRWWDGTAWTSYVADGGVVAIDDALPTTPPPPPVDLPTVPVVSWSADAASDDVARAGVPVRIWRGVRSRPLWARVAALLVVAVA